MQILSEIMLPSIFRWMPVLRHSLSIGVPPSVFPVTHGCTFNPGLLRIPTPGVRPFSEQVAAPLKLSKTQKLKVLVKEYGPLAMGLYLTIGFISIGACYAVISVGVNVEGILNYFGMEVSKKTAGFSTLAIAYLMHKLFLPLRIGLTIGGVPVIARYLRRKGWMRPSAGKQKK